MNTSAELLAGVRVWPAVPATAQTPAPGYSPTAASAHAYSPVTPGKGRDKGVGECFSLESELRVLGSILLDANQAFALLREAGVGRTHFYDLRCRELFVLFERMQERAEALDVVTAYHRALEGGLRFAVEGPSFIAQLPDLVPTIQSLPTFIEDLCELRQRRLALDVSRRLERVASDRSAPAQHLVEDAETALEQLRKLGEPARLRIRSAAELVTAVVPENDNILGDRLLAKGQPLTLLGAGGLGKSRLLLQLAACVITGRPFVGLRTHAPDSKWLVFQAENSERRLRDDLDRLRRWLGHDWPRVAERLFIHTIQSEQDAFLQLDGPGVMNRLGAVVAEQDPDVICFDPLNCFGVGDLNRDADMRTTCQALTQLAARGRTDRALVVLHHALTGKAGAARATGLDRSSFGRNSKLLQAWTRGQINLAPANPNDNQRLVVSCGKCSNGEEFQPYAIRLDPETMIYDVDPQFNHEAWQRETVEGRASDEVDPILELLTAPLPRAEVVRRLTESGHARATAYRLVHKACSSGLVATDESGRLRLFAD